MVENSMLLNKVDKYDREIALPDESNLSLQQEHVYIKRYYTLNTYFELLLL